MTPLRFDEPAGANPIDHGRVVGTPVSRVDGPLKVTGQATYAYEYHHVAPDALVGVALGAGIARGRIARLDARAAERAPGVRLVMTHLNAPPQGPREKTLVPQLKDDVIHAYGQPVALVVADSFEQARAATFLIDIAYETAPGRYDLVAELPNAIAASTTGTPAPPFDTSAGDIDQAMRDAAFTLDATYRTAAVTHAMMESYATMARWEGDALTLWTAHQLFTWAFRDLPGTLLVDKDKLRLVSAFVGGGFGGKLFAQADAVLAALAARRLGRPVKVALTRPQIMNMTRHGPATVQRLRLGCDRAGRLEAIGHDVWYGNAATGGEPELSAVATRQLYAAANRETSHRHVVLDLPVGSAMRGPGERSGLVALESAMDELAYAAGIDPVELRVTNDVSYDPEQGPSRPFSRRNLIGCLRTGAERFGWARRRAVPGSTIDGRWLVGMGVAAGYRKNQVQPSDARVTLRPGGTVLVECATTDIGVGSYTILAQTATEMLGVPVAAVEIRIGDSLLPHGAGGGGSWGANSATSGVYATCLDLRRAVLQRAGIIGGDADFVDGEIRAGNRVVRLADVVGNAPIVAEGGIAFGTLNDRFAQASFAAHFCEVGVDRFTAEIRVRRWLTVADIGRVINSKTARSQVLGGISFAIGAALMEGCVVDTRHGFFVNHDLAGYHVPTHADVPALDVMFLEDPDPYSSPMKAKGVGELGACGSGGAILNAICHATGVRMRDIPVAPEALMERLGEPPGVPADERSFLPPSRKRNS